MKLIIFLCLTSLVFTQVVQNKNACNACTQLKSQLDCTTGKISGCEWVTPTANSTNTTTTTGGNCQVKVAATYLAYCTQVSTSTCAQTTGCALVDSKCTHFTGCSAYTKTTTAECQAITYECVSDGERCIQASLCTDYKTQTICETTPSISGILKCKWDTTTNACRDYVCSEADSTLTTDEQCDNWLSGCVQRGKGCWSKPLPLCSAYAGDATTCATYIGSDGNCELAAGATNCQAKVCTNAPNTTNSDPDCKAYQKGCITTGKGCIAATVLPQCSTYSGDISTCVGYIGSDGICEGDAGGSQCRSRKCENGTFTTEADCAKYKTGCKTTGKGCIATLGACSSYQGTQATCAGYIGTDGYCKGTSTTTTGACTPKLCEDAPSTTTTDAACAAFQFGCKTTGQGCLKTLPACSTYTGDASSCASRIGNEGNCTWVSGTNCVARTCAGAATTVNTNTACQKWFTNCVTNGAGCVSTTTCDNTIKDLSCQGTTGCSWQPVCISNAGCGAFSSSVSICTANKGRVLDYYKYTYKADGVTVDTTTPIYKFVSCAWRGSTCVTMECSDLTGAYYATDANCAAALTGCISNKKDACITSTECTKLTGTMDTCKGYAGAYCTNIAEATPTSACATRKCTDNTDATDTPTCNSWYPGCITNGKGCVNADTACSAFTGTQSTCDKLFGYQSASTYVQCYNSSTAQATDSCTVKACNQATGKASDSDCSSFLTGCVYDGKESCVAYSTASCLDFNSGTDGSYCDKVQIKDKSSKYCYGSAANQTCKTRQCSDNTTATDQPSCESFKTGCILKSGGGCDDYNNVSCSSQQGTTDTCPNYFGHVASDKVRCTKLDTCLERSCSEKTASAAADCTTWKSSCRFFKANAACIDAQALCTDYSIPDTASTEQSKFTYCTGITNNLGLSCGYEKNDTKCSLRKCEQVLSTYTTAPACTSYYTKDVTTGSTTCKSAGTNCYTPVSSCAYAIDTTTYNDDSKKTAYCQLFTNDSGVQCTYKSPDGNCSLQDKCEKVITATSAKVCNDIVGGQNICQKGTNGTGCTTTVATTCSSYNLPSGNLTESQKQAFCQSLKVIDNVGNFADSDAVYTSCIWKAGGACDVLSYAACTDISSAVSQADCDSKKTGCVYYNGKCIAKSADCSASLTGLSTSSQKALFCLSQWSGSVWCKLNDAQTACEANADTDCSTFTNPTTAWDTTSPGTDALFCQYHTDKTRKIFCKASTTATKCEAAKCEDIPSPTNQGDCDKYVFGCKFLGSKCNTVTVAAKIDCADTTKVGFGTHITGLQAAEKLAYCQSVSATATTVFCTYDSLNLTTPTACVGADACNTYTTGTSDQLAFCNSKVNASGKKCSWTTGNCREWDCYDIASPQSQVDCDLGSQGLKCTYYKGSCYNTVAGCDKIPAVGTTSTDKSKYCVALTSNSAKCLYITGAYCAKIDTCANFDVSAVTGGASIQLAVCNTLTDSGSDACTFVQKANATKCVVLGACVNYVVDSGSEAIQCPLLKSDDGYPCKKHKTTAAKCDIVSCEDISTGQSDCSKNAAGCLYYSSACITKTTCGSYTFPDAVTSVAAKTAWCNGVTDTSGNLCKWDGTTQCTPRSCSDVQFYTDLDCSNYLKGCKTDGQKCVAANASCSTMSGDTNMCISLTDSSTKDKCKATAAVTPLVSGNCSARTCYDNVTATNDSDCNTFMSGCVTRGTGCIPNTATCDQYRGTKTTCEAFKQYISTDANGVITYKYCSGDATNTATSACKNRICADNTSATDDTTCAAYLLGCVSTNPGCIEASASCTQYKGTNAQCSKFMGNSGADYCQGTASDATTSAACRKRLCTDISATNNKSCYDGMPPLKDKAGKDIYVFCVYDGVKSCVDNNKSCSFFKGNVDTCPLYTATDGPCKATTIGSIVGTCAKRVCTEAPNTLTTDADCQAYHSSCYTTGYGCTTNNSCSYLTNQASCSSRVTCTWTNQCKSAVTTCSTFSNTSQSQCVNTKVNGYYCAWSETGSICRAQTCADQPGTIKDHATCQAFSESCTTSGAGCVTMTACSYYTVQSICLAAATTKDGISRCGWENNACRPRACYDKSATTTAECDAFLSGCQTNGTSCVAAKTCTDFNGNQQYCQKSQTGPCLYVGGICYDYTQCEDAPGKTHGVCQSFSPLCTTNGTNCIPITSCEKTTLKASCFVGTDGACGWLPVGGTNATEKCQKFGACTDAVGTTNDVCYSYGPTCVSDGTACIALSTCATYKTQTACNNNGTDGLCFWNATTNVCKLKDCGDATSSNTTNEGCASFAVASGSCTTDGTKCIPLSTCSSYIEAGCFVGTDGTCTFAYPIGTTTGTKSCRLKACEDITGGTSNGACTGLSKKKCVSNGTSCISKAACTTYTTKTACNGGGVDSAGNDVTCAFTVTDPTKPNIGTCKQFSQCSDANNDSLACSTKSSACLWKASGTTTSCTAYACDTITSGTNCQPVPSFDGQSYTVCNLVNGKCAAADPGTIADSNCYTKSAYTYSWNTATSKCVSCLAGSTTPTNNTTNTNNTNSTNDTTTTYGYLLGAMTLGLLGFMA